jgi:hypothetical protein
MSGSSAMNFMCKELHHMDTCLVGGGGGNVNHFNCAC